MVGGAGSATAVSAATVSSTAGAATVVTLGGATIGAGSRATLGGGVGSLDESLTGPGIAWGAAKAHVHLARHRKQA